MLTDNVHGQHLHQIQAYFKAAGGVTRVFLDMFEGGTGDKPSSSEFFAYFQSVRNKLEVAHFNSPLV